MSNWERLACGDAMDLLTFFGLIAVVCLLVGEIVSRLNEAEERRERELREEYDSEREKLQRLARDREVARQKAIAKTLQAEKIKEEISKFKASSVEEQLRQICEEHRGDHLRLLQEISLRLTWPTFYPTKLSRSGLSWVEKALFESFGFAFTEFRYVGNVKTRMHAAFAFPFGVGVSNKKFGQRSVFLFHSSSRSKSARSNRSMYWQYDFEVDPWKQTVRITNKTVTDDD